jgi:hypothetical protein
MNKEEYYKICMRKPLAKRPFGRPRRGEVNFITDLEGKSINVSGVRNDFRIVSDSSFGIRGDLLTLLQ